MTGPAAAPAHVDLDGIQLRYRSKKRDVVAVERVDMSVRRNSFVSIIGPSGCGKSSLLKVISKVLKPHSGRLRFDGVPAEDVDVTGTLSFMFQQPLLLPWRTVLDNVMLPLQITQRKVGPEGRALAIGLLETVGLRDSLRLRPHELSGGMRQRAALARALVTKPKLLLMDEPFGAVDEITRERLQEQLLTLWQREQTTIVMVTHQIEEAILLSDQVVVMSDGPGTVLATVRIDLPRPRDPESRRTPEFHELVDHLRGLLHPSAVRP
ncbi:ABC transporter ATP-binding protein [Dactylosporangium sp. CA-233914]|uniref:ABC transporter ATP-binding protein n=1 Tax=Dactylosporangium sp. CA-233914 TaxID=3239934 RepID=UPI003D8F8601